MITKAIVEAIVDTYTVKVRIPRIDRLEFNSIKTPTQYLNDAIICTLPNCDPNLSPGDIVFVAMDDQNEDEVIILGHLYRKHQTNTFCDLILNELEVKSSVVLPSATSIGDISYSDLSNLKDTNFHLTRELNILKSQLDDIQKIMANNISITNENLNKLNSKIESMGAESIVSNSLRY